MRSVALVALAACSSAAATTDFFGTTIEPPRGLMWVQPGMSADEAIRLVPGLQMPDRMGVRDELVLDTNVSDVALTVRLDGGTVSGIVAIVQGHGARDLLPRAWGPPQIAHDSLGQPEVTRASESPGWKVKLGTVRSSFLHLPPHAEDLTAEAWSEGWKASELGHTVLVWPDPNTGWRATLRDALGYSHDLAYDNFLPASHLLGDQPDSLDGLPAPILGRSVEEVKKAYADNLAPGKELAILLLPTEWERAQTRISLYVQSGKIHAVNFALPYKPPPEARDMLHEQYL